MKYSIIYILLAAFFSLAWSGQVPAPSSSPSGYTWQSFKDIKARGLKPDGWKFHRKKIDEKVIYRIVKDKSKRCFLTGLTINAIKDVTRKTKLSAQLYAAYYIYDYQKASSKVLNTWNSIEGPFVRYGCEVVKPIKEISTQYDFHIKVAVIANRETDTLYVILFGTPEKEWESYRDIQDMLMGNIILNKHY